MHAERAIASAGGEHEREIATWKLVLLLGAGLVVPLSACYGAYEATRSEFTFDLGINGLQPDRSVEARNARAIEAASEWAKSHNTTPRADGGMRTSPSPPPRSDTPVPDHPQHRHRTQSRNEMWLNLAFETKPPGGDVSSEEVVRVIRDAEHAVQSHSAYDDICLAEVEHWAEEHIPGCQSSPEWDAPPCNASLSCAKPISPLRIQAESGLGTFPILGNVSELTFGRFLSILSSDSLSYTVPELNSAIGYFFDGDYAHSRSPKPVASRIVFRLAQPLEGYKRADQKDHEQRDKIAERLLSMETTLDALSNENVTVLYTAAGLTEAQMKRVLLNDLKYTLVAAVMMVICLVASTHSFTVAIAGVFTAVLAFPAAFAIYIAIGQRYLSWLHGVLPFLWLGLGVDDILVMNACMHSTGFMDQLTSSTLSRALKNAARTMIPTTVTTATVFGSLAFRSLLPPVRTMGLLAMFVVAADIILVVMMVPAAYALSAKLCRYLRGWYKDTEGASMDERLPLKVDVSQTMSLDDSQSTFLMDEESRGSAEGERGMERLFSGHLYARKESEGSFDDESSARSSSASGSQINHWDPWVIAPLIHSANTMRKRIMRASSRMREMSFAMAASALRRLSMLLEMYANFVEQRWHWVLAVSFVFVVGASVTTGVLIEPATQAPQILRDHHFLRRVRVMFWNILYTNDGEDITLSFGVTGVEESSKADTDAGRKGHGIPLWDPEFDLSTEESQLAMKGLCSRIERERAELAIGEKGDFHHLHTCLITRFNFWLKESKGMELPLEPWRFNKLLAEYHEHYGPGDRTELAWWGNRVRFLSERFWSPLLARASSMREIESTYNAWEALVDEHNQLKNATAVQALHASDLWIRVGYKRSVKSTAQLAPGVTLSAAVMAILISTFSLSAAGAAVVSLVIAVLLVISVLVLCGWHFGVLETISLTLMIGSSIDYCVHLASSWFICGNIREALWESVPTILAAVTTTVVSASFLLMCEILVFANIGLVLMLSSTLGVAASIFTFPSLLVALERLVQRWFEHQQALAE